MRNSIASNSSNGRVWSLEDKAAVDCSACFRICLQFRDRQRLNNRRRASTEFNDHLADSTTALGAKNNEFAEEEFRQRIAFLSEVPVFRRLPKSQYPLLARSLRERVFGEGDTVCKAGDETADFFLIAKGSAKLFLQDADLEPEILHAGDYFGAKALELGRERKSPVTIIADKNLHTLELSAKEFENHGLRKLLRFPGRAALGDPTKNGAGFSLQGRQRSIHHSLNKHGELTRSEKDLEWLAKALRENKNLRSLVPLTQSAVKALCTSARRLQFAKGATLLKRGEYSRTFYIVEEGKCELRADSNTVSAAESLASVMSERMHRKEHFLVYLDATPRERSLASEANAEEQLTFNFSMPKIKELMDLEMTDPDSPRNLRASPRTPAPRTPAPRTPARPLLNKKLTFDLDGDRLVKRESDPGLAAKSSRNRAATHWMPQSPSRALLNEVLGQKALKRCLSRTQSKQSSILSSDSLKLERNSSTEDDEYEDSPPFTPVAYDDQAIDPDAGGGTVFLRHATSCNNGVLGTREHGDSFGELALMYNAPQASTVIAAEDTVVWAITQGAFREVTQRSKPKKKWHAEVLSCLDGVDILSGLWANEKQELVKSFQFQNFQADDWVVREGDDLSMWVIVVDGELACYHQVEGQMQELVHLGPHEHFGERALLQSKPSEFSVKVTSARARCLTMDKAAFSELAGFLRGEPLLNSAKDASLQTFMAEKKAVPVHQVSPSGRHMDRPGKIDPTNFTRIGILGSGAYGLVTLEKDETTGQRIAVKALSKGHIVTTCSQEHVKRERELLLLMDSPFIVRLLMTSQDDENLYFYFDPALGGDLRTLASRSPDLFLEDSKITIFTMLCLVCALDHVHERSIIFRDLKPENVLLNTAGVAQLCDFGFARLLLGKARTLVGTPEYLAPEVVKHEGYDKMVDWWALGVLNYELLAGIPPFGEADEEPGGMHAVFRNIIRGIKSNDRFPFSNNRAKLFILGLLETDPRRRLGRGGAGKVAEMAYLRHAYDYKKFCARQVTPPYIPHLDSDLDAFDEDVDLPPVAPYTPDSSGWDADF